MRVGENGMLIRNCIMCDAEITLCFGSILTRDFVPMLEGKIVAREFCGHCCRKPTYMKRFAIAYTEPEPRP